MRADDYFAAIRARVFDIELCSVQPFFLPLRMLMAP